MRLAQGIRRIDARRIERGLERCSQLEKYHISTMAPFQRNGMFNCVLAKQHSAQLFGLTSLRI